MTNTIHTVHLKCPNCGATLQIGSSVTDFACAYCGTQHAVDRGGGVISLRPADAHARSIPVNDEKACSIQVLLQLGDEWRSLLPALKLAISGRQKDERARQSKKHCSQAAIVICQIIVWGWIMGTNGVSGPAVLLSLILAVPLFLIWRTRHRKMMRAADEKMKAKHGMQIETMSQRIAAIRQEIQRHRTIIEAA